ncbi:GyrI-like domain-containing protein [Bacteroidota bacterium]
MKKIDFKKEYKDLYKASAKKVSYINVPKLKFLKVDGNGYPEKSPDFQPAIEALYSTAYTLKYMLKEEKLQPKNYFDFVVPPLESLWWMEGSECFDPKKHDDWRWTLMIMQADYIDNKLIEKAKEEIKKKKAVPYLKNMRYEYGPTGKAAQFMHIGPYNDVNRSIDILVKEFEEKELEMIGKHYEIYLSDPRRVPPERLKTIIRFYYK